MNHSQSLIRIRYAETDQMGVAYHGALIPWFEVGRTDWLRNHVMCYADLERKYRVHLAVVETSLQYRRRMHYDDEIVVNATLTQLGSSRLSFAYKLQRDDELCATGHSTHVCVDATGSPQRWPSDIHDRLKKNNEST